MRGGTWVNPGREIYTNITYNYSDPIALNDANTDWSAATHVLSARIGYKKRIQKKMQMDCFLAGENLTDTHYSLGYDLNAAGGRYYNTAPGRNVTAGIQLNLE